MEKHKHAKKFVGYKEDVFQIPSGELEPGNYTIDFSFILPDHIPSSLNFKDKKSREEPKAKVKYFVKVKLDCKDDDEEMKYKQVLVIREKPVDFEANEQLKEKSEIKTWCCIDQGKSKLKSTFEKNVYQPDEEAVAEVKVDNEECKLDVSKVSFFIE